MLQEKLAHCGVKYMVDDCRNEGRKIKAEFSLVLTKFKEHAEKLAEKLCDQGVYTVLLMGGGSAKEKTLRLKNKI